jgi:hypothetical protein
VITLSLHGNFIAHSLVDVECVPADGAVFFRKVRYLGHRKRVLFNLERGADGLETNVWKVM